MIAQLENPLALIFLMHGSLRLVLLLSLFVSLARGEESTESLIRQLTPADAELREVPLPR